MNVAEIPMRIMRRLNVDRIWELEDALAARPDAVHARTDLPERFEIVAEGMKRDNARPPFAVEAMPHMMDNYGCSICIRVCPFQKQDLSELKNHVSVDRSRVAG